MQRSTAVKLLVPGQLREHCAGARDLDLGATNVRAALDEVEQRYPALYVNICDETGAIRRHINVFVNTSHIRDLAGLDTELLPGDEVIVLPAVSGG